MSPFICLLKILVVHLDMTRQEEFEKLSEVLMELQLKLNPTEEELERIETLTYMLEEEFFDE